MKTLKSITLLLLIALGLTSCQEVVDIDVPSREPLISVVGRVTDSEGVVVTISVSADYFSQVTTPKINDARVFLFEDDVMVSELTKNPDFDGYYTSGFGGQIGKSYEILVEIPEGSPYFESSSWRSTPEIMRPTVVLDSFNVKYLRRADGVFEEGYYAQVYFQELPGRGDHYRIIRHYNDSVVAQDINITDDLGIDGAYFGGPGFPAYAYSGPLEDVGDSLGLEISSVSEQYYDYLAVIVAQVFQVGSTFDPPPAPVIGNIYNVDNPKQYGYGYFAASALASGGTTFNP
jgi:hypothetical protein